MHQALIFCRKVTEEADLLGYVKVILQILMHKQAAHTWKAACLCLCHGEFFSGCYAQKGIGRVVIGTLDVSQLVEQVSQY